MAPRRVPTGSEAETFALGRDLAGDLRPADVVLLQGDLGMGKTVLARGLAAGLGVPEEDVRSPTFTLINLYQGRLPVYHIDLYRIDKPAELEELGLEEILGADGVAIVEWAERLGPYRPPRGLLITITDRGGSARTVEIDDTRD
ncbi:MAG TPA: tRNA (adenosine(37)-N6)-threonylcarbamoyltransferase complex ATPase subunit type 1 TsaE [Candidatus Cryosericum sp.]|nr:tRNA (adenosine(37)-N6)-threonylcarbamoyltransferase complex ATPase subunit type 1 TsaE [Candidatus Cryosericum sp.]